MHPAHTAQHSRRLQAAGTPAHTDADAQAQQEQQGTHSSLVPDLLTSQQLQEIAMHELNPARPVDVATGMH
jgi:hypothetical protein